MGTDEKSCGTCGSALSEGDEVCARCGTPVPISSPDADSTPRPAPESRPAQAGEAATVAVASEHSTTIATQSNSVITTAPSASESDQTTAVRQPTPARPLSPVEQDELESLLRQAHVHLRRRNIDTARELAAQAAAIAPDYPVTHEMLGLVLEADGDDLGAYRQFRAACEQQPAPPEAEAHLAKLTLRLPPETVALLQPPAAPEKALPASAEARLPAEVRSILASAALAQPPRQRRGGAPPFASLLLPGLGQWLNRDFVKSIIMFLVWVICLTFIAPVIHADIKNPSSGQMSDPAFWTAVAILVIDYLVSVADAGLGGGSQVR
ncbi:MAG TPA: hypothetical protein VFJ58_23175 [Armatimonadota bacterium]|nr:hypothetical protein [Armatimonadota bacterium]